MVVVVEVDFQVEAVDVAVVESTEHEDVAPACGSTTSRVPKSPVSDRDGTPVAGRDRRFWGPDVERDTLFFTQTVVTVASHSPKVAPRFQTTRQFDFIVRSRRDRAGTYRAD